MSATSMALDDLFRIVTALAQDVLALSMRVTALEGRGYHRSVASTATRNQTYTWQPGGWVTQYCEAVGE